jgi:hypothetical protein
MALATGVAKQVRYKKESAWGVLPGTSGGQLLRRTTSTLNLNKDTYQSQEIRSDYQIADFRHGLRRVGGAINGELSCATYQDFFAQALRRLWTAGATTGAITTVTASVSAPHFVRSTGSFLTDGFKIGDIVRWTGWTTGGTANNAKNFTISALTATQMTVLEAVAAKAAGDSVTCTVTGKKTFAPTTGHTDESFTIEQWFSDITQSEQFTGCKVNSLNIDLPSTGIATITLDFLGKDMVDGGAVAYFTSPAAETTTGVLAAVNGRLMVDGASIAIVTAASFSIAGNYAPADVIGSNFPSGVFPGRVNVTGEFSAWFENTTLRNAFLNETNQSLFMYLTEGSAANANVLSFGFPNIKTGSAEKDDTEQGITQRFSFQSLLEGAGGTGTAEEKTSIIMQDTSI